MKKSINHSLSKLLFLPLIVLMTFSSCQDEVVDITEPNDQEVLTANSTLANLIQNTSLKDGSFDNIIDNANCISINLPVTIIVNGIEITIDSEDDLAIIETIYDQFSSDVDDIEIVFPITIKLNDFTEVTINDLGELEGFVADCAGENEDDDDIECIDFQYPVSISVFNTAFEVINTVTINSDEELYDFIEDLEGGLLAGINFPVTMIKADGSTIVVNNNDELQAAIEAAKDTCDEDDDNDYDDDDENDIPVDDLNILCSNCTWEVARLEIGNENREAEYVGYVFTFVPEGPVMVIDTNGTIYEGTWALTENENGIPALSLNIPDIPDFNNDLWLLSEIIENDDDTYVDFRNGQDRLKFKRLECDEDNPAVCSEEAINSYLAECHWTGDVNGTADFDDYDFYFKDSNVLKAYDAVNSTEVFGSWTTSTNTNGDTIITIDMLEGPLVSFNGVWTVLECYDELIIITKGDEFIVYQKECEQDTCTEAQVDEYLATCVWNPVNFNGIIDFSDWELAFNTDGTLTITNTAESITANWATSQSAAGVTIDFSEIPGSFDLQGLNDSWSVIQCASDRIKVENENGDFVIFEKGCSTDEGCSEADVKTFLMTCEWTISNYAEALTIQSDNETYTGNWTTSLDGFVYVELSNISGGNVQVFNGINFKVVECTEGQMVFHDVTDSSNELVLDKICN